MVIVLPGPVFDICSELCEDEFEELELLFEDFLFSDVFCFLVDEELGGGGVLLPAGAGCGEELL